MLLEKPVLVIGGGISGVTAAVEAAETGADVVLVEKEAFLGGRVFRMNKYFPKLCSPHCGMEINFQRIRANPKIRVITQAEVESISGSAGNFEAKVKVGPVKVNDNCTTCGKCSDVCPVDTDDHFNYDMAKRKAIFMPHLMSYPPRFAIDNDACKGESCGKCVPACPYNAIELGKGAETETLNVQSVVFATGWKPYDSTKLTRHGFGTIKNVVNNVMFERLSAPDGPTGGKLLRPSDGKEAKNVAFIQCAGSRDENHLPWCSSICCLASLKHATYVREAYPEDGVAHIFYIDMRTPGKYEEFYQKVSADEKVNMVKGKVAQIEEDKGSGDVLLHVEDVMNGEKKIVRMDLAVLATGMKPSLADETGKLANMQVKPDENGFLVPENLPAGIHVTGVAEKPIDVTTSVMSGTAVALKTIQEKR